MQSQEQHYQQFKVRDGLQSNTIYSLFEDSKGYLWIGTDLGLMRFNGQEFINIMDDVSYPGQEVYRIVESEDGVIWVSTNDCELFFIKNGKAVPYEHNQKIASLAKGLNWIVDLQINEKEILLALSTQGTIAIDEQGTHRQIGAETIEFIGKAGNLMLKTSAYKVSPNTPLDDRIIDFKSSTGSISSIRGEHLTYYSKLRVERSKRHEAFALGNTAFIEKDGTLEQVSFQSEISSVYADVDDSYLIGTFNHGLYRINETIEERTNELPFLNEISTSCVLRDTNGNLWIGTIGQGLYMVEGKGLNKLTLLDKKINKRISALHSDNGLLYIGYYDDDMVIYEPTSRESRVIRPFEKSALGINDIHSFKGTIIVSSILGKELALVNGDELKLKQFTRGVINKIISSGDSVCFLSIDQLNVFSALDSLIHQSKLNLQPDEDWDPNTIVKLTSMEITDEGKMLIGTDIGLFEYADNTLRPYSEIGASAQSQLITDVVSNSSILAIGTDKSGVIGVIDKEDFELNIKNGLLTNRITCLQAIDDLLIVGTYRGVCIVDLSQRPLKNSGLLLKGVIIRSMEVMGNRLYIGTDQGLYYWDIKSAHPESAKLTLFLKNVYANGEVNEKKIDDCHVFDSSSQNIVFDFESIDISQQGEFEYSYRLEPSENPNWTKTSESEITFAGIESGEYVLHFKSSRGSALESTMVTTKFKVQPPFTHTWLFYGICSLILLGAFVLYGKYNQREERARLARENRQAYYKQQAISSRMNPHFIFNGLNSLQDLIIRGDKRTSLDYVSKLSKLMRKNIEYAKEEIIILNQEIALLKNYCELESMRFEDELDHMLIVGKGVEPRKCYIPSMVLQPVVENAIWHGLRSVENRELTIEFKKEEDQLITIITDNGIGREEAKRRKLVEGRAEKGQAIRFIRRRLELFSQLYNRPFSIEYRDRRTEQGRVCGTVCTMRTPYIVTRLSDVGKTESLFDEEE